MIDFSQVHSRDDLYEMVSRVGSRSLGADHVTLYILDPEQEALAGPQEGDVVALDSDGLPARAAFGRETIFECLDLPIPGGDGEVTAPMPVVCCPVVSEGRVSGALLAVRTQTGAPTFEGADQARVEDFARAVGAGLVTLQLREDLQGFALHAEEWLVAAVEQMAPGGDGHVWRVSQMAKWLAECLGFTPADTRRIWTAARYHDLGWVLGGGRPRWEVERYHATTAARELKAVRLLEHIAPLVETHHERFDGSGFPAGLGGSSISLEGYVLAFCDDLDEWLQGWITKDEEVAAERRATLGAGLRAFIEERAPVHHPRVISVFTELEGASPLRALYS